MSDNSPDAARHDLLSAHVAAFPGHEPAAVEQLGGNWIASCAHCTWSAIIVQQGRVPLDPDWTE